MKNGRLLTGIKRPLRKIIGNRKRFASVWASKTCFTETDTNAPRAENANDDTTTETRNNKRFSRWNGNRIIRPRRKTMVTARPKHAPPEIFPTKIVVTDTGYSISLSSAPVILSNVMTIASIAVVLNRRLRDRSPGIRCSKPIGLLR
jgi:hypothetical protein